MAQNSARTYLVINEEGEDPTPFRHVAPAGAVVTVRVDGRPARVKLTDTPLPGRGNVFGAELLDRYL
ncbi:hypothetical protein ACFQ6U_14025 [Streptomyces sp. NPDC056465]|uniref:hypothetical protein n=1 Tax=unclassified Streptomyces TaxID=2593676 RepID=UPI0035E27FA3